MQFNLLIPFTKPLKYLDPGTGSFLIQVLIAALASVLLAVGIYWRKLKGWLLKAFNKDSDIREDEFDEE